MIIVHKVREDGEDRDDNQVDAHVDEDEPLDSSTWKVVEEKRDVLVVGMQEGELIYETWAIGVVSSSIHPRERGFPEKYCRRRDTKSGVQQIASVRVKREHSCCAEPPNSQPDRTPEGAFRSQPAKRRSRFVTVQNVHFPGTNTNEHEQRCPGKGVSSHNTVSVA